jgi:hypothetical protein
MVTQAAEPTLWMKTDAYGHIHDIAPDTASLLGLSARGAYERDARLFFPASYRSLSVLLREAGYQTVEGIHDLYPRDRKRVQVRVRIEPCSPDLSCRLRRWTLEPV